LGDLYRQIRTGKSGKRVKLAKVSAISHLLNTFALQPGLNLNTIHMMAEMVLYTRLNPDTSRLRLNPFRGQQYRSGFPPQMGGADSPVSRN
jgi:hypothetical protein